MSMILRPTLRLLSASGLMASIVVLVALCCSLSHFAFVPTQAAPATRQKASSPQPVWMIHPTFNRARYDKFSNRWLETDQINSLFVEDRRVVPNPKFMLFRYVDTPVGLGSSNMFDLYVETNDGEMITTPGYVSYATELEVIKRYMDEVNKGDANWLARPCHMFASFRGFEITQLPAGFWPSMPRLFSMGLADNLLCLISHNQQITNIASIKNSIIDPTTIIDSKSLNILWSTSGQPLYSISSMQMRFVGVLGENADFLVEFYDEAGNIHRMGLTFPSSQRVLPPNQTCVSIINLDNSPDCKIADRNNKTILEAIEEFNPKALATMRAHFDHAFIESITLFENALYWSSGWRVESRRLLNSANDPNCDKFPRDTCNKNQGKQGLRALEAYKHGDRYYYHIVYANYLDNGIMKMEPQYFYCSLSSFNEISQFTFPIYPGQKPPAGCFGAALNSGIMPIDVVFVPKCERLFAFYSHTYREFKPNESLNDGFTTNKYKLVKWMTFPITAILYANDRLYLFGGGNNLIVSKPVPNNCDFNQLALEDTTYHQSDLVRSFAAQYGHDYSTKLPVYNSARYVTEELKWVPGLNEINSLPEELLIRGSGGSNGTTTTEAPISKTPPTTNNPLPIRPDNTSGSMIIIVIIVIVIIGIICGCLYYFYFATADEAPRRPKSSRPRSKSPIGQQQATAPLGGAGGKSAIGGAKSTLSPTMTVRSSTLTNSKGASSIKPGAKVVQVKSVKLEAKSPKSAKSAKSAGSNSQPKSAKSVKSISFSKSPKSTKNILEARSLKSTHSPTGKQKTKTVKSKNHKES